MTNEKLKQIKEFAEWNWNNALDYEQLIIETDFVGLSNPWIDQSGRFPLNDEGAVKAWGLDKVINFCWEASIVIEVQGNLIPITVEAVYTGGNIWLYYGKLASGNYFLTDDNGCTLILNANPGDNFEEACFQSWQDAYKVEELDRFDRKLFIRRMMNVLRSKPTGGISEMEINAYERYMLEE